MLSSWTKVLFHVLVRVLSRIVSRLMFPSGAICGVWRKLLNYDVLGWNTSRLKRLGLKTSFVLVRVLVFVLVRWNPRGKFSLNYPHILSRFGSHSLTILWPFVSKPTYSLCFIVSYITLALHLTSLPAQLTCCLSAYSCVCLFARLCV